MSGPNPQKSPASQPAAIFLPPPPPHTPTSWGGLSQQLFCNHFAAPGVPKKSLAPIIQWYRMDARGNATFFAPPNPLCYVVDTADEGCTLGLQYTPVRADGVRGDTINVHHPVAVSGVPDPSLTRPGPTCPA